MRKKWTFFYIPLKLKKELLYIFWKQFSIYHSSNRDIEWKEYILNYNLIIQDEKYNEIYRKAEEKFFEDLKYYNASPVSEESIKRFNYSEIQIQEKNEKAKKHKIFLELVKYLCERWKNINR